MYCIICIRVSQLVSSICYKFKGVIVYKFARGHLVLIVTAVYNVISVFAWVLLTNKWPQKDMVYKCSLSLLQKVSHKYQNIANSICAIPTQIVY